MESLYGDVALGNTMVKESDTVSPLRPVIRKATDADIKHHEENKIRQYEYENFVFSYKAYKALGGNSFIDKIYKEVQTWEVYT